ncbi:uncharacterized protein AUP68_10706 [Ilyonectria robusta]
MSHFITLLKTAKIDPPCIIITDRELALMKALKRNPELGAVPHILCRWYVNMNVLAKCKQHFPKAIHSTAAAATVQAAILREASQLQSTPPPSTAPAAINTLKESNTSLGLRRLEAGDSYEPGTEPPRSYMRIFQRLEDVDDDAADDTATNAMVTTPRELSLVEDNRLAAAFSQFSQWSDADTPGETLHPDLEDRIYQLA